METTSAPATTLSPELRMELLKKYRQNSKQLTKMQHSYRKLLGTKPRSKVESIKRFNFFKRLRILKKEKSDIVAYLTIALGKTHVESHRKDIQTIRNHVDCQERLEEEIDSLNNHIQHLRAQKMKIDEEILKLNFKATSERQHNENVRKARTALLILENQLENSKKRECDLITKNMKMRNNILDALRERELFHKLWTQMITHLDKDKKFLVDLVERAIACFEKGAEVCQKISSLDVKKKRDIETKMLEMQELIKREHTDQYQMKFLRDKSKVRELAALEPRECKRREIIKTNHNDKMALYNSILEKVLSFSGTTTIAEAIEKYKKQENIYYSYFNYSNDLGYQIQVLNKYVDELYSGITGTREKNIAKELSELKKIAALEKQLAFEEQKTKQKKSRMEAFENNLHNLFNGLHEIFNLLDCSDEPLKALLGDHTKITVFNVERFLKIFEKKLNSVLAYVYATERKHKKRPERMIVQKTSRKIEEPTPVEDIVLAQQCAECAEGDDVKPYDEEFVYPKGLEEIKNDLREKVKQPEMDLRLHSVSQCRLPRSRQLADKRY